MAVVTICSDFGAQKNKVFTIKKKKLEIFSFILFYLFKLIF